MRIYLRGERFTTSSPRLAVVNETCRFFGAQAQTFCILIHRGCYS